MIIWRTIECLVRVLIVVCKTKSQDSDARSQNWHLKYRIRQMDMIQERLAALMIYLLLKYVTKCHSIFAKYPVRMMVGGEWIEPEREEGTIREK